MGLPFEWHQEKSDRNLRKHGVAFAEATSVFADPLSLTIGDPLHSESEERLAIIGESERRRLLVVVHTERGDRIRLISARLATPRERKTYEEGHQ